MEEANEKENEKNRSGVSGGGLGELQHLISSSESQRTVF